MYRGNITFKCTRCGNRFTAPDYEYAATIYTCPQRCPKCGSMRTRPAGLFSWLNEWVYREIWRRMEGK